MTTNKVNFAQVLRESVPVKNRLTYLVSESRLRDHKNLAAFFKVPSLTNEEWDSLVHASQERAVFDVVVEESLQGQAVLPENWTYSEYLSCACGRMPARQFSVYQFTTQLSNYAFNALERQPEKGIATLDNKEVQELLELGVSSTVRRLAEQRQRGIRERVPLVVQAPTTRPVGAGYQSLTLRNKLLRKPPPLPELPRGIRQEPIVIVSVQGKNLLFQHENGDKVLKDLLGRQVVEDPMEVEIVKVLPPKSDVQESDVIIVNPDGKEETIHLPVPPLSSPFNQEIQQPRQDLRPVQGMVHARGYVWLDAGVEINKQNVSGAQVARQTERTLEKTVWIQSQTYWHRAKQMGLHQGVQRFPELHRPEKRIEIATSMLSLGIPIDIVLYLLHVYRIIVDGPITNEIRLPHIESHSYSINNPYCDVNRRSVLTIQDEFRHQDMISCLWGEQIAVMQLREKGFVPTRGCVKPSYATYFAIHLPDKGLKARMTRGVPSAYYSLLEIGKLEKVVGFNPMQWDPKYYPFGFGMDEWTVWRTTTHDWRLTIELFWFTVFDDYGFKGSQPFSLMPTPIVNLYQYHSDVGRIEGTDYVINSRVVSILSVMKSLT